MLSEYGLIPDVFETSTYSSPEVCDLRLGRIKEILLQNGLVRDFRAGEWSNYIGTHAAKWDNRAKELFKKLKVQNRLVHSTSASPDSPANNLEWCHEALASHHSTPLTGIIAGANTAAHFKNECLVRDVNRLDSSAWWNHNNESVSLGRCTSEYLTHLGLILKHSNLLMFIDPHLNPSRGNYAEFLKLLLAAKREDSCSALIQIHRVCYEGCGRQRTLINKENTGEIFDSLHQTMAEEGLKAEVFIWDDFHDRYLITDLIGIVMPNGFDISGNRNEMTTWARISRANREKIQREFDSPNNAFHKLIASFTIGRTG